MKSKVAKISNSKRATVKSDDECDDDELIDKLEQQQKEKKQQSVETMTRR